MRNACTWRDGNGVDDLRLTASRLTNDESGAVTTLEVSRVRRGEEIAFALEGARNRGGSGESIVRCYAIHCELRRPDGEVIKVIIVTAESSGGFYSGLKSPELSSFREVEGQMVDHLSEIAKQRVIESAKPQHYDIEAMAEALFGSTASPFGFGDDDDNLLNDDMFA